MKLLKQLNELINDPDASDYETRQGGEYKEAGSEYGSRSELASWLNDYVEDWRYFGDIPKDTPNFTFKDIPHKLAQQVATHINEIDIEGGNEDYFEDKRGDIARWTLRQLNFPIPD